MSLSPTDWRKIGQQVRERRDEWGLTQARVAADAGVSQPLVSRIERGGCSEPTLAVLRVLHALNLAYIRLPGDPDDDDLYLDEPSRLEPESGDGYGFVADLGNPTITLRTSDLDLAAGLEGHWSDLALHLAGQARTVVRREKGQAEIVVTFESPPEVFVESV